MATDGRESKGPEGAGGDTAGAENDRSQPTSRASYRPGWKERVLGWLFAAWVLVFVVARLLPFLILSLIATVARALVYLILFGRRPNTPEGADATGPEAGLEDNAEVSGGAFTAFTGAVGAVTGGVGFVRVVAFIHSFLCPPPEGDGGYHAILLLILWIFVAFPLGATLGFVTGRGCGLLLNGHEAAAREVALRGGTGLAVGMALAAPVAVVSSLYRCAGDSGRLWREMVAEVSIHLLAMAWGLLLRRWGRANRWP